MATFGLVHGHWHGAWCWAGVGSALEARGHTVVAMDLSCDHLGAGCDQNANVVIQDLDDQPEPIVLVGHSAGGLTIPIVARRRRVERLIFVAALLPLPGRSLAQQFDDDPEVIVPGFRYRDLGDGRCVVDREEAMQSFYEDCPENVARDAAECLRPQTLKTMLEVSPLDEWPATPRSYIVCRDDRCVSPAWQRGAARERLGVDPLELAGSHSPALARPNGWLTC